MYILYQIKCKVSNICKEQNKYENVQLKEKKIPIKICTLVNWVKGSLATLRPRVLATENL